MTWLNKNFAKLENKTREIKQKLSEKSYTMTDRATDVDAVCRINSHNNREHLFLISKLIELCNIYKRGNQANINN